jgi:hypothetical protein
MVSLLGVESSLLVCRIGSKRSKVASIKTDQFRAAPSSQRWPTLVTTVLPSVSMSRIVFPLFAKS